MVVQILEAGIATTILLIAIIYIGQPQQFSTDFVSVATYCLEMLDARGELRQVMDDQGALNAAVQGCLPPTMNFVVRSCLDADCSASINAASVSVASRIVAGNKQPQPRLINLWVWEK